MVADEIKGDSYDCGNDFQVLSLGEKRGILKTAKTLLKEQIKVKALFGNARNDPAPVEAEMRKMS